MPNFKLVKLGIKHLSIYLFVYLFCDEIPSPKYKYSTHRAQRLEFIVCYCNYRTSHAASNCFSLGFV